MVHFECFNKHSTSSNLGHNAIIYNNNIWMKNNCKLTQWFNGHRFIWVYWATTTPAEQSPSIRLKEEKKHKMYITSSLSRFSYNYFEFQFSFYFFWCNHRVWLHFEFTFLSFFHPSIGLCFFMVLWNALHLLFQVSFLKETRKKRAERFTSLHRVARSSINSIEIGNREVVKRRIFLSVTGSGIWHATHSHSHS